MKCPHCDKPGRWPFNNPLTGKREWFFCDTCDGHGWLPFWSNAERSGMKAMGDIVLIAISHDSDAVQGIVEAIRAYVKAASHIKKIEGERT